MAYLLRDGKDCIKKPALGRPLVYRVLEIGGLLNVS
jgi:hypothetical protein